MVSDTLSFLRGLPEEQAAAYNNYLPKSTRVRMDLLITGQAKVAQMNALADAELARLQEMQDSANASESQIRNRLYGSKVEVSEAARQKIQWAYTTLGLDLPNLCEQLIADEDVEGLAALKQYLPWLDRAKRLERPLADARKMVASFEETLYTPNQRRLAEEIRECDINMGFLRDNFENLQNFYQAQKLPTAVAGTFMRLDRLLRWDGLPGDKEIKKGVLVLSNDVGQPVFGSI